MQTRFVASFPIREAVSAESAGKSQLFSEVRLKTAKAQAIVNALGLKHPLKSGSRLPSTAAIPELFYKCLSLFGLQGRRNPGVTLYTCFNPASLFCCSETAAELNQKS